MTTDEFRRLALALPEAVEQQHMQHPDFRVGGKIFATLGPDGTWGMVKLRPEQQAVLIDLDGKSFAPANGAWGARGATIVQLAAAKPAHVRQALELAWRQTAPKRLVAAHDGRRDR